MQTGSIALVAAPDEVLLSGCNDFELASVAAMMSPQVP